MKTDLDGTAPFNVRQESLVVGTCDFEPVLVFIKVVALVSPFVSVVVPVLLSSVVLFVLVSAVVSVWVTVVVSEVV